MHLYMYLHSSMDRFEVVQQEHKFFAFADLHSSMDRFEVWTKLISLSSKQIYIPVWIDLKPQSVREKYNAIEDLHSSMDRFEDLQPK